MSQPPQHTIHFSHVYASVCGLLLARNVVFQLATLAHQVALLLHTIIDFLCPPLPAWDNFVSLAPNSAQCTWLLSVELAKVNLPI